MKSKLLTSGAERTFVLVFDIGDEVMSTLLDFAKRNELKGSRFTAIGAFSSLTVGYFEWEKRQYKRIPIDEQVEVLSLIGDVAVEKGEPKLHAHVVVGLSDGTTRGGHLLEARVRPTLELMLTEAPANLQKRMNEEAGIALIDLSASD